MSICQAPPHRSRSSTYSIDPLRSNQPCPRHARTGNSSCRLQGVGIMGIFLRDRLCCWWGCPIRLCDRKWHKVSRCTNPSLILLDASILWLFIGYMRMESREMFEYVRYRLLFWLQLPLHYRSIVLNSKWPPIATYQVNYQTSPNKSALKHHSLSDV